jgi:hypothetical protein
MSWRLPGRPDQVKAALAHTLNSASCTVAPQPFAQVQPYAHPLDVVGGVRLTWDDGVQRHSAEQQLDDG